MQNYTLRVCSADLPYYWDVTDTTFGVGTESGVYRFRYTNVLGCDSSVYLNLTVNPSYEILDTLELCQNELPYPYPFAPNHQISAGMDGRLFRNREGVNACVRVDRSKSQYSPKREI